MNDLPATVIDSYDIPSDHPRALSLQLRKRIEQGVASGITSPAGLIAHGRGEAFDYLLGEKTHPFAIDAINAAASLLRSARHPVISVNGNSAALCATELVLLSKVIPASIEVNIFHTSSERELRIRDHLLEHGATEILLPSKKSSLHGLTSNRRFCHPEGIYKADVVFVPLEDGDRAEALLRAGKKVITIDLNPLSRTAKTSTITIVDNIIRSLPLLIAALKADSSKQEVNYHHSAVLAKAEKQLRSSSLS